MNPEDWRKFYKPAYKKMFECVCAGGAPMSGCIYAAT